MNKYIEDNAWDMFIGGAPIAAGLFLLYVYIVNKVWNDDK